MNNRSCSRRSWASVSFISLIGLAAIVGTVRADDPTLPPPEEYVAPEVTDLSGDEIEDLMLVSPLGDEAGQSPGKVIIESGEGGQMMTLNGGQNNDWFGYSVAVVPDLNFDGFKELLVGAPRHGAGRAYLFYGPFNDIGVEELTVADADYTFSSPHAGVYNFGAQVAPLHDVTNDDVHDLRIKSFFLNGQGQPVMRTYVYSGLTAELLTTIIGNAPFNPWLVIDGDTDNDADVDGEDLNTVVTNQGLTGNLTRFDGDLNSDGTVNGGDLVIVSAGLGSAHFAGHVGGGSGGGPWTYSYGCGTGDCYVYNCDCELVCTDDCGEGCMSFLECNPPQCPGGGCAVYIDHEPAGTVQCVLEDMTLHAFGPPESEGSYLWNFLAGGSLVQMQGPLGGQTIHFRLKKLGKIKPKVYRNWCGGCEAQDLIYSVWIDSDDDGLPDAIEDDLGTSPTDPDSDGDSVPDDDEDFDGDGLANGAEVSLGFDPTDPDSDGDGMPDGQEDPSEGDGGVEPANCGSFEQDIDQAWACGVPLDAGEPITLCEDETEECDCFTFHVSDTAGGTDDFWFVSGPPGASIDGDPDQDRTSPCIKFDGPGSFAVGVISQYGSQWCLATQTINIIKLDVTFEPGAPSNWPLTDCPNNGGKRIFPDKVSITDSDTPSAAQDRRTIKVKIAITEPKPNVTVYAKVFDVDDPSASTPPVDDDGGGGPVGNDNRDATSAGLVLTATTNQSGIAYVSFPVSMRAGDNYRVFASTSQQDIDAITPQMAELVDSSPACVYHSPMLTVWRHVLVELDSMVAPQPNENWQTTTFTNFEGPLGAPGPATATQAWKLKNALDELEETETGSDLTERRDIAIGGKVIIGPKDTLPHQVIDDTNGDIVWNDLHDIQFLTTVSLLPAGGLGFSAVDSDMFFPEVMSGTVTQITKTTGGFVYALNVTAGTPASQGEWDDYVGGTISVGGGNSVSITAVTASPPSVTASSLNIKCSVHDDDVDSLLPDAGFADSSLLVEKYGKAYILPLPAGGGVGPFGAVEVPFHHHISEFATAMAFMLPFQQSAQYEREDCWIAYVVSGYQGPLAKDFDGIDSSGVAGGGTDAEDGGKVSIVFLESNRDILAYDGTLPANQEALIVAHEIGHQFGLLHITGSLMGPIGAIGDGQFAAAHLDQLRNRVSSPGP